MEPVLSAFVTLFVVVDPIGVAAVFAAFTHGTPADYARHMAFKGAVLALVLLIVFFFVGERLLGLLGIGIDAFRAAGGALLWGGENVFT